MSTAVKIWLSILLLAALSYAGYVGAKVWRVVQLDQSSPIASGHQMPDKFRPIVVTWNEFSKVTLIERSGEPLPLKQFEGKVWVLNFFFATCPATCKTISGNIARISKDLADQDVTFVSISVDPETDTPQLLSEYAKGFGADEKKWLFLTGDFELIRSLCADIFKLPVERKTHTDDLVVISRDGDVMGKFNTKDDASVAKMKRTIDRCIKAQPGELRKQREAEEKKVAEEAEDSPVDATPSKEPAKS